MVHCSKPDTAEVKLDAAAVRDHEGSWWTISEGQQHIADRNEKLPIDESVVELLPYSLPTKTVFRKTARHFVKNLCPRPWMFLILSATK